MNYVYDLVGMERYWEVKVKGKGQGRQNIEINKSAITLEIIIAKWPIMWKVYKLFLLKQTEPEKVIKIFV